MDKDAFFIPAFAPTVGMAEKTPDTLSETSASSTTHLLGIVPDEPSTVILPTMRQNVPASTSRAKFRISKLAEDPPELLPKKASLQANRHVEIPVIRDFQAGTGSAMETIVVINTIEEVASVESNSEESEFAPADFLETPPIRRRKRMHLQPCCCFMMCNWFPKMCSCLDTEGTLSKNRMSGRVGTYERLGNAPTIFEFGNTTQRERRRDPPSKESNEDTDRQEELSFYNDDQSWTAVVVEKNLRTIDLCELLKVKRNASGIAWSVVETWPELGIERTLEDHEDILAVHREMEPYTVRHHRKFFFRQDFLKYDFFINPKQFFPSEMVSFPNDEDRSEFLDVESALRNYLSRDDVECPQVFSQVWIRDESSKTWRKMQMLLQGRKLYTTRKVGFKDKALSFFDQVDAGYCR
ncbi:abnormal cell migration protein 10 [Cephus cinctus]|uniref:Abnormal cell migration protein 10 n=1 Tax=Cephus cinctus TaxID=211228 RepID=A0AAJ7RJY9_CEPCN|nr:abnormal cell migration protein 10 [Cephus cinctus]